MQVKTVLIVEGCVNLVIMLVKFGVGFKTGSLALVSDAVHSLGDLGNNVVAWVSQNVSEKAADDNHHYGHSKAEQLAVFTLAILLVVVAIEIVINAVRQHGDEVVDSRVGLLCVLLVLFVNLALTLWQHYWARRLQSEILKADAKHTLSDVLTTATAIVGWQAAVAFNVAWMDSLVAVVVAAIVLYFAFTLLRKSVAFLMDYSAYTSDEIRSRVLQAKGVVDVDHVRARTHHEKTYADLTVIVDSSLSAKEAHRICDSVELVLLEELGIGDVVIHIQPSEY